jgi:hypothetical protein
VRNILTARYDAARRTQDCAAAATTAQVGPAATTVAAGGDRASAYAAPDTAGIATAFAAAIPTLKSDDTQVFHGYSLTIIALCRWRR